MLDYTTYVSQLSNLMVVPSSDTNFTTFLPGCIDYAEQRIYRDLNFINTTVYDTSVTISSNTRFSTLPLSVNGSTMGFMTVTVMNVLTPAGATSSNGTRNPMARTWPKVLNFLFPTSSLDTNVPSLYAIIGSTDPSDNAGLIQFGPPSDGTYTLEIGGTVRPTPLSASNTATFLTKYFPDLFIAASMVFAAGYMRDFGAQSDNPAMAQSWEQQYKVLVENAKSEQYRARFGQTITETVPGRAGQI